MRYKIPLYGLMTIILLTSMSIACTEYWLQDTSYTSCNAESTATNYATYQITYHDQNNCGTTQYLPENNGTIVRCNVPGWDLLMNGSVGTAAFQSLDIPMGNWLVFIMWLLITFVIITKSNSWELSTIVGLIFLTVFLATPWFGSAQKGAAILFMILQIAMVLFRLATKEKNL